jgi:GDP-L-fucose synthase
MVDKSSKIFVAGHKGMVGSSIERCLKSSGYENLILRTRKELNLLDSIAVRDFFAAEKPEYVILAAARVGGIQANIAKPAEFLFENLVIQNNVIHSAYTWGVKKFVFIGSSCIYPKDCPQPMKEEYLLTGKLEPTNEGYALAKIAGLKLLEFYKKQYGFESISLMPCNLYGTNDSFHPEHSHVMSALVRKISDAHTNKVSYIDVWGTGIARREFMHVDDVAHATVYLLNKYNDEGFINIGWGTDVSIKELAEMIAKEVGFDGEIRWDHSKPDGMLRKCMDVSRMRSIGFSPSISLKEGIKQTIQEYNKLKTLQII